jgi:hypothetical protein
MSSARTAKDSVTARWKRRSENVTENQAANGMAVSSAIE